MDIHKFKKIDEIQSFTYYLVKICEDRIKILLKEREKVEIDTVKNEINDRLKLRIGLIRGLKEISKERIKELIKA